MSKESERIVEQWGEQKELKKMQESGSPEKMFRKLLGLEPKKKKAPAKKKK